ncbi:MULTISPECIES: MFS transporter [unclassified Streptomyces]|uniref:MFS transporter n=1 Tax=unclassified Streptomyces TaxID=2593676 RepID=UPI002DDA8234|nr:MULTISPECIES: MFS transporter [unclassified Streptomyces]WSB75677.1 MFS transporter [Streptomyces sp. NBC_01775]WSS16038.1 MFS transporter [Streptomyces sp. NBC_01186]WSS44858.1 MFS transporter [Streptomyces sp. NBC_01187]
MNNEVQQPHDDVLAAHKRNSDVRSSDITVTDEATVRRATRAAAVGNAMEWFDFGIYAYLAVTIGKVFFPGDGGTQLLASFTAFAASFLIRPLGGLVFGPLGDRLGRKQVLSLTMVLMAASTFCIGLIPSYDSIGIASPVLLLLFRMLQGFSTGGEYGGAATFIAEYAPDKRRGYFGSFLELGTLIGYIGAAGLVLVLNTTLGDEQMLEWGWRIPFLIGGPIGVVGLYLRTKLEETPAFQKQQAQSAGSGTDEANAPKLSEDMPRKKFTAIFTEQWRMLLLCIALVAAYNITNYMLLSYMPAYLTDALDYKHSMELVAAIIAMVAMTLVIQRVGNLADRFGRKPLLMAGMGGFAVLTIPVFALFQQGSFAAVIVGLLVLGACLVCLLGTMSATLPALFPTEVRYGSLSIGYNVSTSLFGGTAPGVMTYLVDSTHDKMAPAYYASAAAVLGVIVVALMKETAQQPLPGSPPSVSTDEEARALARPETHEPVS